MLEPFAWNCPGLSGPESRQNIGRVTFGDFLNCRQRIVIPIFQRRYCWDDKRVVGWWNDVLVETFDNWITTFWFSIVLAFVAKYTPLDFSDVFLIELFELKKFEIDISSHDNKKG